MCVEGGSYEDGSARVRSQAAVHSSAHKYSVLLRETVPEAILITSVPEKEEAVCIQYACLDRFSGNE